MITFQYEEKNFLSPLKGEQLRPRMVEEDIYYETAYVELKD